MADFADAFIALPEGLGTFEEFFEAATWTQLGLQRKPLGLVNLLGYYDGVLAQLDRAVVEGFLISDHRRMLLADERPGALLDAVLAYTPPVIEKWAVMRANIRPDPR